MLYMIPRHVWWAGRRGSWNNSHGNQVRACWNLLSKKDRASRCRGGGIWQRVAEIKCTDGRTRVPGFTRSEQWDQDHTSPLLSLPGAPCAVEVHHPSPSHTNHAVPHLLLHIFARFIHVSHLYLAEKLSAALRFPEDGGQPPESQGGSPERDDLGTGDITISPTSSCPSFIHVPAQAGHLF